MDIMMRFLWVGAELACQDRVQNIVKRYFPELEFTHASIRNSSLPPDIDKTSGCIIFVDGRTGGESEIKKALDIKRSFLSEKVDLFLLVSDEEDDNARHRYSQLGFDFVFSEIDSDYTIMQYLQCVIKNNTQFVREEENRKMLSLIAENTDNSRFIAIETDVTQRKIREEKLKISEERFRMLVENIMEGLIITGPGNIVEYASPAHEEIYGFSSSEIVGKDSSSILKMIHPDDQQLWSETINQAIAEKNERIKVTFRVKTAGGEYRWREDVSKLIYDDSGELIKSYTICHDIHNAIVAKEDLKAEKDKIVAILDASPAAIIVINMDEKIEMCNRSSEKLFGHNQQRMLDHRCGEFIGCIHHGTDGKICGSTKFCSKCALYGGIKKVLAGTDSYSESEEKITLLTETGPRDFWLSFSIESIILDGKRNAIVALTDITRQKESQEMENKLLIAENTARIKQNFLANMSHEMRTPLNGIIGISDILKKTSLDDAQRNYLRILEDSSKTLLELINSVLDLSKIESGKVDIAYNTIETAVFHSKISSLFNALAVNQNLEFQYDVPDDFPKWFVTDESKLNQITTNLLGNAIKFTKEGFVKFEARVITEDESHWVLRFDVSDTGRGIPTDKLEEIFDQFTQVDDSKTRHLEGTGLGLTISRNLVNLLGGDIHVESEVGKGSKFWFTIRAEKPDETETGESESGEIMDYVELNLKVLIVEDLKVNRLVVNLMLQSMGCETEIAVNGLEALHKITANQYDIVLMDIQMPVMDGLTAVQELRKLKIKLPVIIGLSAEAMEGDAEKYITAGMDDYMTKPVKSNLLAKKLIKWKNKLIK
jgi:PAS domain S-box-containing protein